ncbi:hypothetical protein [Pedobacter sp. Leaf194]|uniref:hypothetical protein n=1 Tax=Pedobacter sp. Leaf194 TaxID=1736297 RepID=UPI0007030AD2|nr:hypothetical protein [Pedobacter sp. Leaf194]KQS36811.1 hypothetical protein ASG14_07175 [Pedobacter sp. Leaf194]
MGDLIVIVLLLALTMKKFSYSSNQKRLIKIWLIINSVALIVNLADIRGEMIFGRTEKTEIINGWKTKHFTLRKFYLFKSDEYTPAFWPSVHFTDKYDSATFTGDNIYTHTKFNGIFFGYGWIEFFFYTSIGFAIPFVQKLWE